MASPSAQRKSFLLLLGIGCLIVGLLLFTPKRPSATAPPSPAPTAPIAQAPKPTLVVTAKLKPPDTPAVRPAQAPDHSPLADQLNAPDNTPERDLEILTSILGQFTSTLKPQNAPPLGDNQDITAALTGHNKMHIVFIPPDHLAIDSQGRLLDRWGTPYLFHARSAETFDLRSAGPDKTFFTADDVVRPWK